MLSTFAILKWLIDRNVPIPNNTAALNSGQLHYGGTDCLELLDAQGFEIDVSSANNALIAHNIDLLEWLYDNKNLLPDDLGIEMMLNQFRGNYDTRSYYSVLQFLFMKGVHFSQNYIPPEDR